MARLGDLERSVMDVLWDSEGWLTARDVAARLRHERDLAYTTVLTVLERLERKGFVQRQRAARAHRYRASDAREAVVAEAMLEALGTADDRGSALVRFVGAVSPEEVEILRRALALPAETGVPAPTLPADDSAHPAEPTGDVTAKSATESGAPGHDSPSSPDKADGGNVAST
ncbi:BlaI/MecI/CopY family transcriptional regulator [Frankia sp. CNm7]|uniref:BlaI/MecI/CopY family transcriptional regulator n=1 Tax=Frankia nepalensis TaxID=1836974 RepID=A0A937RIT2_9ACTN|nr:BlaI/MecI/CopY family transcriptional regulator [Frankia nepalensis]MBL7498410.1 BlaI/MecI/CopY family transcriptional regulator [Frankia nepalensis]MBL7509976.1 BlaI/MecI/CopY family transcriptional regulator [Frankia nepalensis]MBL7520194.1 BlaI/MecI/CopY family transcriptional regulator [Frankia nepalensis]MBL7629740.1 BlaI/MecI/CopY family transcriptional regulator [Frankia nepalensis]